MTPHKKNSYLQGTEIVRQTLNLQSETLKARKR